jgi:hypothetical protein
MLHAATPTAALALAVVLILAVALTLAACGGSGSPEPSTPLPATGSPEAASAGAVAAEPFTTETLIAAFEDAGLTVKARPWKGRAIFGTGARCTELLFGPRGVEVSVFPSEKVADKAVAGVSEDGTTISAVSPRGTYESFAAYEFIGPVHHFARGRIIVFYVERGGRLPDQPLRGRDARILAVLESVLGPQFAGQGGLETPRVEGTEIGEPAAGQ